MAGTITGGRAGVIAVLISAALLAPSTAEAARSTTEITISSKVPAFHGRVSSEDESCRGGRVVQLFRKTSGSGRKSVGSDKTPSDGGWAIEVPDLRSGLYFAKVKSTGSCRGVKSESVIVD